jgi:hypothetical protein
VNEKAIKAVEELSECDHGILTRDGAQNFAEDVGLDSSAVPVHAIEHHPEEIKGARLTGCTKIGEKRMGVGADVLASWACRQLGVKYSEKFGRGSQLRECCSVLLGHFKQE